MNESHTSNVSRQSSQPFQASSPGLPWPSSVLPPAPSGIETETETETAPETPALPTPAASNPIEAMPPEVVANTEGIDEAPPREPPFAVLSDGRILVSVKALENRDVAGSELWTGVILSDPNAAFVMHRADNAAHETAAHLAARYPRKS